MDEEFRRRVPSEIDFGVPIPCQGAVVGQFVPERIIEGFDTDLSGEVFEDQCVFGHSAN